TLCMRREGFQKVGLPDVALHGAEEEYFGRLALLLGPNGLRLTEQCLLIERSQSPVDPARIAAYRAAWEQWHLELAQMEPCETAITVPALAASDNRPNESSLRWFRNAMNEPVGPPARLSRRVAMQLEHSIGERN